MQLEKLIAMSRKYGADENYVLAGGGNTSYKEKGIMAVKASGSALANLTVDDLVLMDISKLNKMLQANYPNDDRLREKAASLAMNEARLENQGDKRPSVECILHSLFPYAYVLHLHPALVNGLTCGQLGKSYCLQLFGDSVLWIDLTKPGFILSQVCDRVFTEYKKQSAKAVDILFLQNHGLFVAGDSTEEIDDKLQIIMNKLDQWVIRRPDMKALAKSKEVDLSKLGSAYICHQINQEVIDYGQSAEKMMVLQKPFTPDHIVYCKAAPLYLERVEDLDKAYQKYLNQHNYQPKIVMIKDLGVFALGDSVKAAETALSVFMDGVKIAVYSESFGGPLTLTDEVTDFILNWEIESYRAKKSLEN